MGNFRIVAKGVSVGREVKAREPKGKFYEWCALVQSMAVVAPGPGRGSCSYRTADSNRCGVLATGSSSNAYSIQRTSTESDH